MKNKILPFIIGLLVGAILATGGFYLYENAKSNDTNTINTENRRQMGPRGDFDGETPPDMPDGENSTESNSSTKRTRPDKNNSNSSSDSENTPPEKPADDNSTNNKTESNT